jgi:hypothetical protein
MLQLAELVLSLTGSKCKLVSKPLPSDDPRANGKQTSR